MLTAADYWPWKFEEPIVCKHGKTSCDKCGLSTNAVAHTTRGGRGYVSRLMEDKKK